MSPTATSTVATTQLPPPPPPWELEPMTSCAGAPKASPYVARAEIVPVATTSALTVVRVTGAVM